MKFFLSVLFLIFCSVVSAQFNLEHTYENIPVTRIKLGINGEKYYQFKVADKKVIFYNADHSFWKEITLTTPEEIVNLRCWIISDDLINNDSKIEIAYSYSTPDEFGSNYLANIIDEDGAILFSLTDAFYFQVSKIEGLSTKIFIGSPDNSFNIYSTDLLLEHTFTSSVNRIKLENSGEKYYRRINEQLRLYSADYSA